MALNRLSSFDGQNRKAGFSLTEMLVVIGIIGILVGVGAMNFVTQISTSKVETGIQILNANFKQARQNAIAMRRTRRVAIDTGFLDGVSDSPARLAGSRTDPVQVWIEGKELEEYDYSYLNPKTGALNAYELTDPEKFPDGIMVTDVDGIVPSVSGNPRMFYVEFNARGAISNVYFEGKETSTRYNEISPVIHLARDGETFKIGSDQGDYLSTVLGMSISQMEWKSPPSEDNQQRYKVQTIEVVRLTGKTRTYDYAIMNPWPIDEFSK